MLFPGSVIGMHPYRVVLAAPSYDFRVFGSFRTHGVFDNAEAISCLGQGLGDAWHK